MKRLLIFGVSFALGMGILLHFAGDIRSTVKSAAKPIVRHVDPARAPTTAGHRISVDGRTIEAVEGLVQTAPPERIIWKDKLSDEVIEIPVFFPWRFRANDLVGTQPADADTQGVVCTNVRMLLYRQPETRAEAVALRSGDKEAYEALLNQTFSADEARVFGRLGEALNRNKTQRGAARLGDTKLILSGNVHVVDIAQGFDVRGEPTTEVTVWPEQGRAEGRGPFTMTHEAFKLTGEGLSMEQNKDAGWADVDILRNPVLRIHSDVHDADGKPMFNFGGGDFKPTHVVSRGKASLHRETNRRDTILKITFFDKVRAEQQGGRSLDAGRVELLASQPIVPRNGAASSGWQLQYFLAEERVAVEYPGKTRKGEAYLASITSNRLFHEIPEDGSHATTELTGDVVMNMRGEIPVLGPGGRLRATCRDSATIGPLRQGSPTGGHEFDLLQEISLRGEAVIERTESGLALAKDTLEGDAIDLVVLPKDTKGGIGSAGDEGSSGMIAIHFAARGNVRLGGTRINGNTHRLIGEALDTDRPRILAEGPGTHFAFPNLGSNQRLLGPGEQPQDAPATNNGGFGAVPEEETEDKGKWLLHRLLATGLVDIDTSLGGPAIGIPAQVSGDELSYSRVSQQAQVIGKGGRQARIAWTAPTGQVSHLETRTLTLDQGQGRLTADGGVAGEFWVSRDGLGVSPFPSGRAADAGTAPSELSVRTDARIEVELVRDPNSGRPALGSEQLIKIVGPLTAELRAENRMVDRLKSENLELALVFASEEQAREERPMGGVTRASGSRSSSSGGSRTAPGRKAQPLERVQLTSKKMRLDIAEGEARYIEASDTVEMKSKEGRVTGDRIYFDGERRKVEVLAKRPNWKLRPAVAWLGVGDERMEIQGVRLALTLDGNKRRPAMLEADSPQNSPAVMQLYRKATDSLPGEKRERAKPKANAGVEWFTLTYWGTARMVDDSVVIDGKGAPNRGNSTVRIVRRLKEPGQANWGPPAVLWSPTLRVVGSNMLASDGAIRDVRTIIAEGHDTTMRSGRGPELVQVWGHRFEFDVLRREATLRGLDGRPVRFAKGDPPELDTEKNFIVIDMKTNLPKVMVGARVRWRPPKNPNPAPAPGRRR